MSMRTVIPARWHCAMAVLTSGLSGSESPTIATKVRSRSKVSTSNDSKHWLSPECDSITSLNASASVLHISKRTRSLVLEIYRQKAATTSG